MTPQMDTHRREPELVRVRVDGPPDAVANVVARVGEAVRIARQSPQRQSRKQAGVVLVYLDVLAGGAADSVNP